MKFRRLIAVVAVGAFVLTAAACSSDDDKDNKANGDTKSEQTDGSDNGSADANGNDEADEAPDTTVTDEEFAKQLNELSSNIDAAGKDVCKLMTAAQASPPEPANEAQTEQFVKVWSQLLKSIGSTLGGDDEKTLSNAADEFSKIVADKGYSPDVFNDEELSNFLSAPELSSAMDRFGEKAMECIADGDGEG